jgi:hypothetical protein
MTYKPDLSDPGPVKGVGYLWFGHSYPRGKIDLAVLDRLVTLAEKPFLVACGYHKCNLGFCGATQIFHNEPVFRYRGRRVVLGSSDVVVPGDEVVYYAPDLILHYIRHHRYRPPECFCAAVLKCPEPRSAEHIERIKRIAPKLVLGSLAENGRAI